MRRLFRRLFTPVSAVSAVLCLAMAALWVRTEAFGRTDTLLWGRPGVYRCVELSSDEFEYKSLHDPGLPARPLTWVARHGGWARPPPPSNPAALPAASATWVLPPPRSAFLGAETRSLWLPRLGFDYAEFGGWYGPGTTLHSYRLSYFAVMIPAAVLPTTWVVWALLEWRRRRGPPGKCRRCGYDLRATPEAGGALLGRCPECGTVPSSPARGREVV